MKSILDPKFPYVSAAKTDIRITFKRIREEQAAAKALQEAEVTAKVTLIRGKK